MESDCLRTTTWGCDHESLIQLDFTSQGELFNPLIRMKNEIICRTPFNENMVVVGEKVMKVVLWLKFQLYADV